MSISKEVIASDQEVPIENVRCEKCRKSRYFLQDRLWCDFWGSDVVKHAFCTFYEKRGDVR